ncbi:hypothetical protein [uncultured Gammaproteobacteria bacterium]|jgi:cbb3-type cytochrome oxidase subunit 3|uniref:[weak similarity to] Cbb3-type cytochromeoxidase component n=3 Tax=sulfur-oxidizing symbionts TaxID=32036 RepID=A0A1H6LDP1_9GAMM|nr:MULTISPECIES: CcoQ/FixQ family Cbb3-type cytochrome c oxidase assembly chaperone [Gammaproteobacteria]CAC5838517.1 hypothetical protein [uncultured Gammaproteobacteria bacterium]CAB5503064.1 hypothetical protein AZO1586I_1059 [Bathymodiolus thermophilus thioautotrophic gill symbiont]CAB5506837.1 hypothetical protein AZO1586R_2177 [Bathymodiolus azoricus thioautotrophic gill symbiont]CAC9485102.1 hypothetical protein [uncultured Gammaproteobacteria bacterium]CAC9491547.1 hypothetical protein
MPSIIEFHIVWTVLIFISFVAFIFWAWSAHRKVEFDEIANIALDLPMGESEKK